jgi:histidinol-phosphatase (PHP family)
MIYKTDYHIHTTFSDGKAKPEEYISSALEKGLNEIGFSDHFSLSKKEQDWDMNPMDVPPYIQYIDNLKNNASGLIIRTGLEIDYIPGMEKEISEYLNGIDLDYRIGSVHYLGEKTVDNSPEFYEGKNIDFLFESYFDKVIAASYSGLFDIIAHCDLIRIYGYKPSIDPEPLYRKLARAMSISNVALEINTNGRTRPVAEFYPDPRYLNIFRQENVAICVNSDAHMPSRVAQYFNEAYDLIKNAGFDEMVQFEKRKRKTSKL